MEGRIKLSLILPAYNEEDSIKEVLGRVCSVVKETGLSYEVIVVDDGSVDETRSQALDFASGNSYVKVIGYCRNVGKGYAIKTGVSYASGDVAIFMDSDLEVDPMRISQYVQALNYGDLIIASRWLPDSHVKMPLMRRFLSHGFNMLVKLLIGLRVRDTQSGLKAARREALKRIFSKVTVRRYAFDVELLAVAKLYGLRIVELPVNVHMTHGLFSLREILRIFVDLLRITYRLRFLKWYQHSS